MYIIALTLCFIGIAICAAVIITSIYFLIRNERVYKFRNRMIDEHFDIYHKLPSYDTMLYDGKPLKIESYINNQQRNKINNN